MLAPVWFLRRPVPRGEAAGTRTGVACGRPEPAGVIPFQRVNYSSCAVGRCALQGHPRATEAQAQGGSQGDRSERGSCHQS